MVIWYWTTGGSLLELSNMLLLYQCQESQDKIPSSAGRCIACKFVEESASWFAYAKDDVAEILHTKCGFQAISQSLVTSNVKSKYIIIYHIYFISTAFFPVFFSQFVLCSIVITVSATSIQGCYSFIYLFYLLLFMLTCETLYLPLEIFKLYFPNNE